MAVEKFYFAWVDEDTDFDPDVHNVVDENILSFQFEQDEGDFAQLTITVKNPRIGLLNVGRKVWAWFSFFNGTDLIPLFHGRLLGLPDDIFQEIVTLKFTARPSDFVAQKAALAATLKARPYWDDLFIKPDSWDDPDTVLEARTANWYIDPVTHVVSISDILVGEDGTLEYPASSIIADTMQCRLNEVPLQAVTVTSVIPWQQTGGAALPLGHYIATRMFDSELISSFTFQGLQQDWPQSGADMGPGWVVQTGSLTDVSFEVQPEYVFPDYFDKTNLPVIPKGSVVYPNQITGGTYHSGEDNASFDTDSQTIVAAIGYGVPVLDVTWAADRGYAQTIQFTLRTHMQQIATASDDDEAELVSIDANSVSDLDSNGDVPIPDVKMRSFIDTDRGLQALEHLILVARAHLVSRARAVELTFRVPLKIAAGLITLRKNALAHDDHIPGGEATGKIISFNMNGSDGKFFCDIKIGCAIGYGGSYTPVDGTPDYCVADYVEEGYQVYIDSVVLLDTSDITYSLGAIGYADDGLDLMHGMSIVQAVHALSVENTPDTQKVYLEANPGVDQAAVSAILGNIPTRIHLTMRPIGKGPYNALIDNITLSELIIPQQINLEAPSV